MPDGGFVRAPRSATEYIRGRGGSPGQGGPRAINSFWSKFLGCSVNVYRKQPKLDLDTFLKEMTVWLCKTKPEMDRNERNAKMGVVIMLVLRDGIVDPDVPIARSIRVPVVEERRAYLFADNSTSVLRGEHKRLVGRIQVLEDRMDRLNSMMLKIQLAEERRRKDAMMQAAEAKMLRAMTAGEDDEADDAEEEVYVEKDAASAARYEELSQEMAEVGSELKEASDEEELSALRLEQRELNEVVCKLILEFLDTLPKLDKEGRPMSLAKYRDFVRMERQAQNQLAVHRIKVRLSMLRWEQTNDCFCGKRELLLFSGLLRSMAWIKMWMKWWKYTEDKVRLKKIGERIGLSSADELLRDGLQAFALWIERKRAKRELVNKGAEFLKTSARLESFAFTKWQEAIEVINWGREAKLVAEDAAQFLLMKRGMRMWQRMIRNNKVAEQKWRESCKRFGWDGWIDEMADAQELYLQVLEKCTHVLAGISGDARRRMLTTWWELAKKKKAALKRWKNSSLQKFLDLWACELEKFWDIQDQVKEKCGNVLAMISGQVRDNCFREWRDSVAKDKRARLRFMHSSLWLSLGRWRTLTQDEKFNRELLARSRRRMQEHSLRIQLSEFADIVDARRWRRALVSDSLFLWIHTFKVKLFRSLDENMQIKRFYKQQLARTRYTIQLKEQRRSWTGWWGLVTRARNLKDLWHRIQNTFTGRYFEEWRDVVVELGLAVQEQLASKSPGVVRWMRRPMGNCFRAWLELLHKVQRERSVLARIRYRIQNACVVYSFADWCQYVVDSVDERREEVAEAVRVALKAGNLAFLEDTFRGHFERSHVRERYRKEDVQQIVSNMIISEATRVGDSKGLKTEEQSVEFYRKMEGRHHLRDRFAHTIGRKVEIVDGRMERQSLPAEKAFERTKTMEAIEPRAQSAGLFSLASPGQREVQTEPSVQRLRSAAREPPENRAHQGVTSWVLGIKPPHALSTSFGVCREHADALLSSSVPVPVSDFNSNNFELRLGSLHKLQDTHQALPPRVSKHAKGGDVWKKDSAAPVIVPPRKHVQLVPADLLREKKYSLERVRTALDVRHSLGHFQDVLSTTRPQTHHQASSYDNSGADRGQSAQASGRGGSAHPRSARHRMHPESPLHDAYSYSEFLSRSTTSEFLSRSATAIPATRSAQRSRSSAAGLKSSKRADAPSGPQTLHTVDRLTLQSRGRNSRATTAPWRDLSPLTTTDFSSSSPSLLTGAWGAPPRESVSYSATPGYRTRSVGDARVQDVGKTAGSRALSKSARFSAWGSASGEGLVSAGTGSFRTLGEGLVSADSFRTKSGGTAGKAQAWSGDNDAQGWDTKAAFAAMNKLGMISLPALAADV